MPRFVRRALLTWAWGVDEEENAGKGSFKGMMKLKEQLGAAIVEAKAWAMTGWQMQFGSRGRSIDSLTAAEAESEQSFNRQEAINYWTSVNEVGQETAAQGEKARQALESNNLSAAHNAVFFAVFLERKIRSNAPTWGPVLTALEAKGGL